MHEASLVQGILKLVQSAVAGYGQAATPIKRVREIVCEYGVFACFEEHTLRACFELFAEGTIAENAALVLRMTPLACKCDKCGVEFETEKRVFACPHCQSTEISFTGGHGLVVQAINVDAGEDNDERTYRNKT